jgi:hypothetical protein
MQPTTHTPTKNDKAATAEIEHLCSFLRGEISAVETYRQVLDRTGSLPEAAELRDCMRSHEHRVMRLREEIARRGGSPPESSGPWGAFVKLLEAGAATFGAKAAIAVLEEGEDHGRNDYQRDAASLGREARLLIEQYLLPEQLRTHAVVSRLKRMLP